MEDKIGVSTGIFARLMPEEELEKKVNILLDCNVKLLEILLARPRLTDIRFSNRTLQKLKEIEVTVHAPFFKEEGFIDADLNSDLLSRTESFAKNVNATHIVIHPDLVRDWECVRKIKIPVLIENLKPGRGWGFEEIKKLILDNPPFKIALDAEHAEKWGAGEAIRWSREFFGSIKELHLNLPDQYKCIAENNWTPPEYVTNFSGNIILETTPFDMEKIPLIVQRANEIITLAKQKICN